MAEVDLIRVAGDLDAAVADLAERFRAALEPPARATAELDLATLRPRIRRAGAFAAVLIIGQFIWPIMRGRRVRRASI